MLGSGVGQKEACESKATRRGSECAFGHLVQFPGELKAREAERRGEREERIDGGARGCSPLGSLPGAPRAFLQTRPTLEPSKHRSGPSFPRWGGGKHPKLEVGGQEEGREGGRTQRSRVGRLVPIWEPPRIYAAAPVHVSLSAGKQTSGRSSHGCERLPTGLSPAPGPWRRRVRGDDPDSGLVARLGMAWARRGASEFPGRVGRAGSGQSGAPEGRFPGPARAAQRPQATSCSPWQRRQQP